MTGPAWLMWALAAVMAAIAAYEVGRLSVSAATGRPAERDVDAFHLAMGVSMAGMLTDHLSPFAAQAWAVVFGGMAMWFACRVPWAVAAHTNASPSLAHRLTHVVSSLAMVYMLLAVPAGYYAGAAMRAMSAGGTRLPALSVVLAFLLLAGAVGHAGKARRAVRALAPALAARPVRDASAPAGAVATCQVAPSATVAGTFLGPGLASACEVAMGLVMAYMLLSML